MREYGSTNSHYARQYCCRIPLSLCVRYSTSCRAAHVSPFFLPPVSPYLRKLDVCGYVKVVAVRDGDSALPRSLRVARYHAAHADGQRNLQLQRPLKRKRRRTAASDGYGTDLLPQQNTRETTPSVTLRFNLEKNDVCNVCVVLRQDTMHEMSSNINT